MINPVPSTPWREISPCESRQSGMWPCERFGPAHVDHYALEWIDDKPVFLVWWCDIRVEDSHA